MKPMVKYRGGKTRELPRILPHMPSDFDRYVEPFMGGGAVFFGLTPEKSILNDLNEPLMDFYKTVRDKFALLRSELDDLEKQYRSNRVAFERAKIASPEEKVHDPNEVLYYRIREMYNGLTPAEYSQAALYFFINKTSYSGMIRYNRDGHFNVPYGRYKNFNTQLVSKSHSELLQSATLYQGDYETVFDLCGPRDFVFLDPPYDSKFSDYGNVSTRDGFLESDHRRLAEAFFSLPAKALMVIGKSDLINELYGDHVFATYRKQYAVNIRNRFQAKNEHLLIKNY